MTPAAAAHLAQRLAAPLELAVGTICRTRSGHIAVVERRIRYRHVEAPGGSQYDGWQGHVLFEDGGHAIVYWRDDGAVCVDYSESPDDLMERVV